jgi:hypothetical protein
LTAKAQRNTFDNIKQQLRQLESETGLTKASDEDLQLFAEMLDESARDATQIAVEDISLIELRSDSTEPTLIRRPDAVVLTVPAAHYLPKEDDKLVPMSIRFLGLSRKNGWGRLIIVGPPTYASGNEHVCKVSDKLVKAVRNPYTLALHTGEPTNVYARERLSKSGKTRYLEIAAIASSSQLDTAQSVPF